MRIRPAALIIQDNKVLTMRYQYGGQFVHLLPGGNPDPGESMPETIRRELLEELGIGVRVGNPVFAGEVLDFNGSEDTLHFVFLTDIETGQPVLNPMHTTAQAIEWLAKTQLHQVVIYPNFAKALSFVFPPTEFTYTGPLQQPFLGD